MCIITIYIHTTTIIICSITPYYTILYIGAYIPAIANHIVQYNTDLNYRRVYSPEGLNKNEKLANLKGIAIGNGVIDMITQVYSFTVLHP